MKRIYLFAIAALFSLPIFSQINVMSYNMLNFPTGNLAGRVDTLANIIDYYRPHLLLIQELKTEEGLQDITNMMNTFDYGSFAHSTFVPQQSGSPSEFDLQQALVYDQSIFKLKSESVIPTVVRDVNEFVLYLNDAELANGADTAFLYVYVTHLKSSTGFSNESQRLSSVNTWWSHIDSNRAAGDRVIIAGDFNLYTNTEPAYTALMESTHVVQMRDVLSDLGNWTGSSFAHKEILTQSTRSSAIYNDGAGGGVDDRFDFILFSDNLLDETNTLHYVPESYASLGNTGACYNSNIMLCEANNPVPIDVLWSMYYMSDHIPQVAQLTTEVQLGASDIQVDKQIKLSAWTISTSEVVIHLTGYGTGTWELIDALGRKISGQKIEVRGDAKFRVPSPTGLIFVRFTALNGETSVQRLVSMQR